MRLHRLTSIRLPLFAALSFTIASCSDRDLGNEHLEIGNLVITVIGPGTLSTRTWNASSSCALDTDAGTSTVCTFAIEDDAAEVELVPVDPTGTVTFTITACGKHPSDEAVEVRGQGLAFRPRSVLLDVSCASYPVAVEAKFEDVTKSP